MSDNHYRHPYGSTVGDQTDPPLYPIGPRRSNWRDYITDYHRDRVEVARLVRQITGYFTAADMNGAVYVSEDSDTLGAGTGLCFGWDVEGDESLNWCKGLWTDDDGNSKSIYRPELQGVKDLLAIANVWATEAFSRIPPDKAPRCKNCGMDLSDFTDDIIEWGFDGSECEREYNERNSDD